MKKLLALILCVITAIACVGCGGNKSQTVAIANFDDYDQVRLVKFERCIGRVNVNKDKKYITQGNSSMIFFLENPSAKASEGWIYGSQDVADYDKNVTACLRFKPDQLTSDLRKISKFNFDVYNDNLNEVTLLFTAVNIFNEVIYADAMTLLPKTMNRLCSKVNDLFYSENTSAVRYYYMSFCGTEENSTFYIDNFTATIGERTAPTITKRASGVLLDFNQASDLDYINLVCSTLTPSVIYQYNASYANSARGYSLCLKALGISGAEYEGGVKGDNLCKKGNGIAIAPQYLKACDLTYAEKLTFKAYKSTVGSVEIIVTLSDGTTTEEVRVTIDGKEWQDIEVNPTKLSLANLTSFQIKLNTIDVSSPFEVYVDEIKYA